MTLPRPRCESWRDGSTYRTKTVETVKGSAFWARSHTTSSYGTTWENGKGTSSSWERTECSGDTEAIGSTPSDSDRVWGLSHGPWFVQKKDVENNVVFVAHADRLADSSRASYEVERLHWIAGPPERCDLQVRVRHGRYLYGADVEVEATGALIHLDRKEAGIAAGQFTVFYDGRGLPRWRDERGLS